MIFCHSQIEAVGDLTQSLPLPLKGEGWGIIFFGFVESALFVHNRATVAQQGRSGASVVFVSLPCPQNRTHGHTGPSLVFLFLVCPWCAHRHILASVFQDPFWEAPFFVTSTANFEAAPPLFGGAKGRGGPTPVECQDWHASSRKMTGRTPSRHDTTPTWSSRSHVPLGCTSSPRARGPAITFTASQA